MGVWIEMVVSVGGFPVYCMTQWARVDVNVKEGKTAVSSCHQDDRPKIVIENLTLLHIQEVLGSDLCPETG
jgi:hypothetical protein